MGADIPAGEGATGTWAEQYSSARAARPDLSYQWFQRFATPQYCSPGENWLLRLDVGIANADKSAQTPAGYVVSYGTVSPMLLRNIDGDSPLNEDRELHINFSKSLPKGNVGRQLDEVHLRGAHAGGGEMEPSRIQRRL